MLQKEREATEKKDMKRWVWIYFLFCTCGMGAQDPGMNGEEEKDAEWKSYRFSPSPWKPASHASGEVLVPLTSQTSQEVAVIVSDRGFFPKEIFATRDVSLRLFLTSSVQKSLCFVMDDFHIYQQVSHQKVEEVVLVPRASGVFRFYCPIDGIEGSLYVRDPH